MACVMNPAFWVYIIFLVAAIMIVRLALPAAASFFGVGPFGHADTNDHSMGRDSSCGCVSDL